MAELHHIFRTLDDISVRLARLESAGSADVEAIKVKVLEIVPAIKASVLASVPAIDVEAIKAEVLASVKQCTCEPA